METNQTDKQPELPPLPQATGSESVEEAMRKAQAIHDKYTMSDPPDYGPEYADEPGCPTCGGDGMIEYMEGGPEVWGEDCPSEENHLVTCPNCRGSGLLKDATSC